MRLLVITNDYPPKPGGIQQYVQNLVERFPGDVLVLAPHDPRAEADERVLRGETNFLWPTPAVSRWVEHAAMHFRPDAVVFGASFPLARLGGSLRERLGVPYAVLGHGAEVTVPAALPLARQIVLGPLRRADVVFTNSDTRLARSSDYSAAPLIFSASASTSICSVHRRRRARPAARASSALSAASCRASSTPR